MKGHAELRSIHKGMPTIVLHGGPGLDHTYLTHGLKFIEDDRNLIFYDQKTCPDYHCEKNYPSMQDLILELEEKTSKFKEYGLITHSWGGLLALEFIRKTKHLPQEVIFITPVPLKQQRMALAFSELYNRVEISDRKFFESQPNEEACLQSLPKILRYYYFDQKEHAYSGKHCNSYLSPKLFGELGHFDSVSVLERLPKQTLWIRGVKDIFSPDPEVKWVEIPKAGHFPFDENQKIFQKEVRKFLHND